MWYTDLPQKEFARSRTVLGTGDVPNVDNGGKGVLAAQDRVVVLAYGHGTGTIAGKVDRRGGDKRPA